MYPYFDIIEWKRVGRYNVGTLTFMNITSKPTDEILYDKFMSYLHKRNCYQVNYSIVKRLEFFLKKNIIKKKKFIQNNYRVFILIANTEIRFTLALK